MTPKDKKHIRTWYWSGAVLIFLTLVIGGITRLTGSGLSMTDWKPIMGAIPPLTESQWLDAFDQYKQFPEYLQVNRGMSLSDFQFIYFWEYLHRMIGRLIGLVFIIPFGWFLVQKKFDSIQLKRALILLSLGAAQGLMGWYMVQSGLIDIPRVSPYRLAAHLSLAFMIFGYCVWFALDLKTKSNSKRSRDVGIKNWLQLFFVLLSLQIIWGAFVAGLDAGYIYNTFPKMNEYWIPPALWSIDPLLINLFENMTTVQWVHRTLALFLVVIGTGILIRTHQTNTSANTKKWSIALLSILLLQITIGVFTLIYYVPVWLGVIHQAIAMILFGVTIGAIHNLKETNSIVSQNISPPF